MKSATPSLLAGMHSGRLGIHRSDQGLMEALSPVLKQQLFKSTSLEPKMPRHTKESPLFGLQAKKEDTDFAEGYTTSCSLRMPASTQAWL